MKKQNKDWEKEFEKEVWRINHEAGGLERGCWCQMEEDCKERLKEFIRKLLAQKEKEVREELEKEKKYKKRNFLLTVETGFLKKPIVRIADGVNDLIFGRVGGFEIETDIEFPKPVIKKFY